MYIVNHPVYLPRQLSFSTPKSILLILYTDIDIEDAREYTEAVF
jgi:hypothetical protein